MAVDLRKHPKLGRLQTRAEFLFVREGLYAARHTIVIQTRRNPVRETGVRVGFTATKKIGNAVVRNRAKRRMRALAQETLPRLGRPGFDYVFIARKDTPTADWENLVKDIEKALSSLT